MTSPASGASSTGEENRLLLCVFDFDLTLTAQRVFGDRDFDRMEDYIFGGVERIRALAGVLRTFSSRFRLVVASWNCKEIIIPCLRMTGLLEYFSIPVAVVANDGLCEKSTSNQVAIESVATQACAWEELISLLSARDVAESDRENLYENILDENGKTVQVLPLVFDRRCVQSSGGYESGKASLIEHLLTVSGSFGLAQRGAVFFDDSEICLTATSRNFSHICQGVKVAVREPESGGLDPQVLDRILSEVLLHSTNRGA